MHDGKYVVVAAPQRSGMKSIGEAGQSWSDRATESSLSLRNNVRWRLISCLQFERLMRLFICRKKLW
jgi:hypothetical protein